MEPCGGHWRCFVGCGVLNGVDICSGGLAAFIESMADRIKPLAYCEVDPHRQAMLLSRMSRGELPVAPIWDDARTFRGDDFRGLVDIVSACFPCTDISLAGDRGGLAAERSGIFWEVVRFVREAQPCIVVCENVWPGVNKYVPAITSAFESLGFRCRDGFLAASDLGAWHERQRWMLVGTHPARIKMLVSSSEKRDQDAHAAGALEPGTSADTDGLGLREQSGRSSGTQGKEKIFLRSALENGPHTHTHSQGVAKCRPCLGSGEELAFDIDLLEGDDWDQRAAFLLRMDHGLPYRGHRIGAVGDACPPIFYRQAFERLMGISG